MMSKKILLVGRGRSVQTFDWTSWNAPVMAVSSGIFALPETVMPEHFASLDYPKYFVRDVWPGQPGRDVICPDMWQDIDWLRWWPFWREPSIEKHVTAAKYVTGRYRRIPVDVIDHVPEEHREICRKVFWQCLHELGYQPGWADFPSCTPHLVEPDGDPVFTDLDRRISIGGMRDTMFFALQVASRMGYRELHLIGIDLDDPRYRAATLEGPTRIEELRRWHTLAQAEGITWINHSPNSALSEFVPSIEGVAA